MSAFDPFRTFRKAIVGISNSLTEVREISGNVWQGDLGRAGRRPPMPTYYFHLYDDLDVPDEEGVDLPDFEAARAMGLQNARRMAAEEVIAGRLHLRHRIEITDADGEVLETIPFAGPFEIVP